MIMKRYTLALGLAGLGVLQQVTPAHALAWEIGNSTQTGFLQSSGVSFGQSFDTSVLGGSGVGTASSPASITSWSFYSNAAPTSGGDLYIFSTPYTGTVTALKSTTTNLIGKSNTGTYNAANLTYSYDFGSGLHLPNSGKYYAYSDAAFPAGRLHYFSSTTTYDGSTLGRWTASSTSSTFTNQETLFDAKFQANFTSTPVPFEFSPTQGVVLGLPLFIGLRMLKKRMALKKSKSEIHEMIRSRVNLS